MEEGKWWWVGSWELAFISFVVIICCFWDLDISVENLQCYFSVRNTCVLAIAVVWGIVESWWFSGWFVVCHGRKAEATSGAIAILHQNHTCSHPVKTSSSYDHKPRKVNVKRFSLRVSDGTKRFIVLGETDCLGNVNQWNAGNWD